MDQGFSLASVPATLLPLAVILACLMAAGYLGQRLKSGRFGSLGRFGRGAAPAASISIIATRAVGAQSSLLIVEAEGHRFLVSAGRQGIRAIGSLTPAPQNVPHVGIGPS